ncbi:trehalose synthase [Desulfovibrio sp. X2]|uniref:maltose alpha-D-glucosyltransferase n=1 Tax=Desulfovibrio sp. X2 TaxID=941449 RepID=UPI000358BDFE|nr:maltose alpha-D-glucosyltransferase [Desulfovibrio sp. X2]EPR39780.1 trehalose synthase [Desulfovibrio sp. X2]
MSNANGPLAHDPLWFKDAIIYEVHVKCFADSDGDGIGDFKGLTSRLDYLADLGITAIWLLPFYPSPLKDDGYDIADFMRVHPDYGTLADFRAFLRAAHARGIRVITELVINHTSDNHAWFQRARRARPGSRQRDYYVWSDTPERYKDARIIFKDFETSNWSWDPLAKAYFWHRFYSHQPDLNYDSPDVRREVRKVMDFWFDMGVDGMRLDAIPYLFEREGTNCENLPETYAFLKELRAHVEARHKDKMLLAEANQWPEDAVAYFGDGDACHMAFHFPLMPRMFMSVQMEDRFPIVDILDQTPAIPENTQWALFLRNHDELTLEMVTDEERDYMYRMYARDPRARINLGIRRRLAPLLENDRRKIELLNVLLFSMPGSVVLYYGDELGMGDNYYLGDRDGVRTPMQWSADRNGGFSRANPQRLFLPVIIDPEYHYEAVNVENQERNRSSLLWWMRGMIAMRKRYKAFGRGTMDFILPRNPKVLAYVRSFGEESILVVANLSRYPQMAELDLSPFLGRTPEEVFSRQAFPPVRSELYSLTLGPYGSYIFVLRPEESAAEPVRVPELALAAPVGGFLDSEVREALEGTVLPEYVRRRGWLHKDQKLRSMELLEVLPVGSTRAPAWMLLCRGISPGYAPKAFNLVIFLAQGESADKIMMDRPREVLCSFTGGEGHHGVAVLSEGLPAAEPCSALLELVARRRRMQGWSGELSVDVVGHFARKALGHKDECRTSHFVSQRINTIVFFGSEWCLKIFRQAEEGPNPDVEIARYLREQAGFTGTPAIAGSLLYRPPGADDPVTVAVLKEYIPAESDAAHVCRGLLSRFFERVLAERPDAAKAPRQQGSPTLAALAPLSEAAREFIPESDLEFLAACGRKTADLHLALARDTADPAFTPEPFSRLYQRSAHQTMQSGMKRSLANLTLVMPGLPPHLAERAAEVLAGQDALLSVFRNFSRHKIRCLKTRVHGDLHLEHMLWTGRDVLFIDFEGKPEKPLPQRRLKRSPFRDLADVQRSLTALAWEGLHATSQVRPEDRDRLAPWRDVWQSAAFGAFLSAYLERAGDSPIVPETAEDAAAMLDAFILEKAFLELGRLAAGSLDSGQSEVLRLPLHTIRRLLAR